MPTPIENNTTALQALKVKAERLPDKTPEVIDYSEDLKGLIDRSITDIKWPEGITKIGDYAFTYCKNLALTALPEGITSIGNQTFYFCPNLALTALPEGITSIGNRTFTFCLNLALTALPEGIISIDESAFSGCSNLALTALPEGITSISRSAFQDCSNLALTALPEGITSIEHYVFSGCKNLALTALPQGIASIGAGAFEKCTSIKKLWIPKGCTTIYATSTSSSPFHNCTNLTDIYTDATEKLSSWGTYWNYTGDSTQATVHYNVTKAEFDAMFNTEYTITWNVGNATDEYLASLPKTYKGIDLPITVEDPVVGQLKFNGWTIAGNLGQTSGTGTIKEGTYGDLTITASFNHGGGTID